MISNCPKSNPDSEKDNKENLFIKKLSPLEESTKKEAKNVNSVRTPLASHILNIEQTTYSPLKRTSNPNFQEKSLKSLPKEKKVYTNINLQEIENTPERATEENDGKRKKSHKSHIVMGGLNVIVSNEIEKREDDKEEPLRVDDNIRLEKELRKSLLIIQLKEKEIAEMSTHLSSQNQKLDSLTTEKAALKKEILELRERVNEFELAIKEKDSEIDSQWNIIQECKDCIEELSSNESSELASQLQEKKEEIAELKTNIDSLTLALSASRKELEGIEELKLALAEALDENEKLSKENSELKLGLKKQDKCGRKDMPPTLVNKLKESLSKSKDISKEIELQKIKMRDSKS